jgi:hypothetical protein
MLCSSALAAPAASTLTSAAVAAQDAAKATTSSRLRRSWIVTGAVIAIRPRFARLRIAETQHWPISWNNQLLVEMTISSDLTR